MDDNVPRGRRTVSIWHHPWGKHVVGVSRDVLPTIGTLDGTRPAKTYGIAPCLRATAEDAGVRRGPGAIAGIGTCIRSDWVRQCDLHEWRHRNSVARRTCVERGEFWSASIDSRRSDIDRWRAAALPKVSAKPHELIANLNGWRMDPASWRRWRQGTSDVPRRRARNNCHLVRSWPDSPR